MNLISNKRKSRCVKIMNQYDTNHGVSATTVNLSRLVSEFFPSDLIFVPRLGKFPRKKALSHHRHMQLAGRFLPVAVFCMQVPKTLQRTTVTAQEFLCGRYQPKAPRKIIIAISKGWPKKKSTKSQFLGIRLGASNHGHECSLRTDDSSMFTESGEYFLRNKDSNFTLFRRGLVNNLPICESHSAHPLNL